MLAQTKGWAKRINPKMFVGGRKKRKAEDEVDDPGLNLEARVCLLSHMSGTIAGRRGPITIECGAFSYKQGNLTKHSLEKSETVFGADWSQHLWRQHTM